MLMVTMKIMMMIMRRVTRLVVISFTCLVLTKHILREE